MPDDNDKMRRWVFDRPVYADGLFWLGVAVGLGLAFLETSTEPFRRSEAAWQVIGLVIRFLTGLFVIGVVGGSVRNFVRGYRRG